MIIVLLPFLGFLLAFFARYLGKQLACILSILSVGIAFIISLWLFKRVCIDQTTYLYQFEWININALNFKFLYLFDPLSMTMTLLITFITLLVMIYSYGYLNEDPSLVKFLSYMSFFAFTMLTLVTAGNYVQLFVGWEGVGLASYFLISFWNTRNEATKGGLKAVVVNRIGDVFFMFALGLMWTIFKSFDFGTIFAIYPSILVEDLNIIILGYSISLLTLLTLCIFIAACAKSAQLILHTWLPDAMEGPTPVSSLLHSATMVTAGVFLIIRSSFMFSFMPNIALIMTCLGVLTAIVSGLIGLAQSDLKKIIAYSTCSQLGFMVTACGLGYYNFALFHLVTHAFFKCLLFLCSGSIIHAVGDEQDLRKMGGLHHNLPLTFTFMTIGNLALCGFPFLAGFYSKDLLLETGFITGKLGFVVFFLLSFAAFLTAFYSFRAFYFTFFSTPHFSKSIRHNIHEAPLTMLVPMAVLTVLAFVSGFLFNGFFTGSTGLTLLRNAVATSLNSGIFEFETELGSFKVFPTIISILGAILSYFVFSSNLFLKLSLFFYTFLNLISQKFYFDRLYNKFIGFTTLHFGYHIQYKLLDRGILEMSTWFAEIIKRISKITVSLTSGYLLHYVVILAVGIFLYLFLNTSITNIIFFIILLSGLLFFKQLLKIEHAKKQLYASLWLYNICSYFFINSTIYAISYRPIVYITLVITVIFSILSPMIKSSSLTNTRTMIILFMLKNRISKYLLIKAYKLSCAIIILPDKRFYRIIRVSSAIFLIFSIGRIYLCETYFSGNLIEHATLIICLIIGAVNGILRTFFYLGYAIHLLKNNITTSHLFDDFPEIGNSGGGNHSNGSGNSSNSGNSGDNQTRTKTYHKFRNGRQKRYPLERWSRRDFL